MGLPAIVGAAGATRTIRTGDLVRLTTSGRVQVVSRAPRPAGAALGAAGEGVPVAEGATSGTLDLAGHD